MNSNPAYSHTQIGFHVKWIIILVVVISTGVVALLVTSRDHLSLFIWATAVLPLVLTVYLLNMFSRMTVDVGEGQVRWAFGKGATMKFSLRVSEITDARIVQNRWWYGTGIRMLPSGTLYNVGGPSAVEVDVRNRRKVRIGTDEPQALLLAIRGARGLG